jgi:hypothetical protein
MACLINLINQLTGNDVSNTDANWYYLGYSTTSQIDASINDPTANGGVGDNGSNCFGIADPTVANGTYTDTPAVDLPAPITVGSPLPFNQQVDFDGVSPGYYGFYYIAGDTSGNGTIDGTECGEIECIEIQVLASPADMTGCPSNPCASYCESELTTSSITLSLDGYINGYIPGGTWTIPPALLGTFTDPDLTLGNSIPAGTYTITYTIDGSEDLTGSATHPIDPLCTDCDGTVNLEIEITATQSAGIGNSITICN